MAELKRTELLTRYAPDHRLVQEVDAQIAEENKKVQANVPMHPARLVEDLLKVLDKNATVIIDSLIVIDALIGIEGLIVNPGLIRIDSLIDIEGGAIHQHRPV